MQNTYLKAFLHLGNFQREASFSTWLTRIMINECLMMLRRHRGIREEVLPDEIDGASRTGSGASQGAGRLNLK